MGVMITLCAFKMKFEGAWYDGKDAKFYSATPMFEIWCQARKNEGIDVEFAVL